MPRGDRTGRAFAAAVVVTIVGVVGLSGAGGASAAAAVPAPALVGNVQPMVSDPNGKVAIVASSAAENGRVAVVVQNGSPSPVRNVAVTGVAKRPDGGSVTRADTHVTVPSVLAPGALALANLDFGKKGVAPGATFTFTVTSGRASTANDPRALAVQNLTLSPPLSGDVAQTLAMSVSNPQPRAVRGAYRVMVTCFNEARLPVRATTKTVAGKRKLAPGEAIPLTVPLTSLCPSYLVGALTAA